MPVPAERNRQQFSEQHTSPLRDTEGPKGRHCEVIEREHAQQDRSRGWLNLQEERDDDDSTQQRHAWQRERELRLRHQEAENMLKPHEQDTTA